MEQQLINKVKSVFTTEFNTEPIMIFSPGRINFIGEHTDYNNGYVFPAAIDKGIYLAIGKAEGAESKIQALDLNESVVFDIQNLAKEVTNSWQDYLFGIVSELKKRDLKVGQMNVAFSGNIDVGSGMSSSAALENAFVFGLNELFDLNLSKREMIFISQAAEHNFVGVKCGIMDQFASMFGKEDAAVLLDCKSLESEIHPIHFDDVSILIINTNVKHKLSDSAYNQRRATCERVAKFFEVESLRDIEMDDLLSSRAYLDPNDFKKASYVLEENNRVLTFKEAIDRRDVNTMGILLYGSHEGLQNKYEVSCRELDFLVDYGREHSYVLGSRMMGGGFGGCTINLIKTEYVSDFGNAISEAYNNHFKRSCDLINVKLSDGTKRL